MALRGSSPVNLSALQRDYSALPKIAAIKAQANQGIFNTIKQGIDDRNQKIKDADEKAANIKVIESIKNSPLGQRVFGETSLSAEDIYASFGKGGQQNFVELLSTMQKANIAQTEEQRRLLILKIAEQKNIDATIDKSIKAELLSRGTRDTGAIFFDADMFENTSAKLGVSPERVRGIGSVLMEQRNQIGRQQIKDFTDQDPEFRKYLTALSNLPKDTTISTDWLPSPSALIIPPLALSLAIKSKFQGKKEFEGGLFDVKSIAKYNQLIKENPEMIQAAGLPSQIAEYIGLGRLREADQEPEEKILSDGTKVSSYNDDGTLGPVGTSVHKDFQSSTALGLY